ncbi:MAG: DNA polymerase I, partial [Spirochaetaceae bacterium]|nr:DNA polymerase I [Spirochaetaceae bacterium]
MHTPDALYLIDAYALIYRSYFAFITKPLRNKDGKNISALFGFARTLISLLEGSGDGVNFLAAVFDSRTLTFRHKQFPQYKAQRQRAPDDLHAQVPLVEALLTALKIPVLKVDGFEADDIIATIVKKCRTEQHPCYIVSSDKDLLQLVGDGVVQLRPAKMNARSVSQYNQHTKLPYETVGREEVCAEWGVPPEKILDLLSLTGDSTDNVPGVKGVGEKTAVKLINRYGSLDEIYQSIASIEGPLAKKLTDGKDDAYISRDLITLCLDVPLPFDSISALNIENIDRGAGAAFLINESIPSLAKELGGGQTYKIKNDAGMEIAEGAVPVYGADAGMYKAILDLRELEDILSAARKQGFFALSFNSDTPDSWQSKLAGLSLAVKPGQAIYAPLVPHGPVSASRDRRCLPPDAVRALLAPLLGDPAITVIAHNAKFDYEVSRAWGLPRWECTIYDTMIAAWLCGPERSSYSLSAVARDHLNYDAVNYSAVVPKGGLFHETPLEAACRYSAETADLCLRLRAVYDEKLKEAGASELFCGLEMPLVPILAEME